MNVDVSLEPRIDPAAARRLYQILFASSGPSEQGDDRGEEQDADRGDQTE